MAKGGNRRPRRGGKKRIGEETAGNVNEKTTGKIRVIQMANATPDATKRRTHVDLPTAARKPE